MGGVQPQSARAARVDPSDGGARAQGGRCRTRVADRAGRGRPRPQSRRGGARRDIARMSDGSLADRLNDLLLRQARERNAPEGVISLLEQRGEVRQYSETGDSTPRVQRGDQKLEIV